MSQVDMFKEQEIFRKYLPVVVPIEGCDVPTFEWDIPYTIPQLAYLVHSHYRYYGKFPSVVAGQILEQYPPPSDSHYVLDNFCGSGTTLVEAKLRGIESVGIDISWLSALASNAKVHHVNLKAVQALHSALVAGFEARRAEVVVEGHRIVKKWFAPEAARDLRALQSLLLQLPASRERNFLLVAFAAIVRRVSKAHNGEVRPHIDKKKKQREVLPAFSKKVQDMLRDHQEFQALSSSEVGAECLIGDNRSLPARLNDENCYLVISHPPYLNSFNYSPVFSLEFYWTSPFESEFAPGQERLHRNELRAHPAKEDLVERYMTHLRDCYRETFRVQPEGGRLAVVIGDCTRKGALIPVVDRAIELVHEVGYTLDQANFRTTHYGLGKYAYSHRADYHGNTAVKRDAILIFQK